MKIHARFLLACVRGAQISHSPTTVTLPEAFPVEGVPPPVEMIPLKLARLVASKWQAWDSDLNHSDLKA